MTDRADHATAMGFLSTIWEALQGDGALADHVEMSGDGSLNSAFAVTDLATASIASAALAVAELAGRSLARTPAVSVDRRLSSLWFGSSIKPDGWSVPPPWDPIAGDYATADGWVRLHTNAPHHRAAALHTLGVDGDREAVAAAVRHWESDALEAAIVAHGGCAAAMRPQAAWAGHAQGRAVSAEPLVAWEETDRVTPDDWRSDPALPLAGVRVLDLTRILAGPVATRFLALFGAEVLRIDPPGWEEDSLAPDITLGKRCARLDLRAAGDRGRFLELLAEADVIIHGYRPDALERLGLGVSVRRLTRPGLVDVSLAAYGWTGPWSLRRGFDSLVQMSTGIAHAGMLWSGKTEPTPLPVQALDHATGYIMAAAAVRGLTRRLATGRGALARLSLARTAALLTSVAARGSGPLIAKPENADFGVRIEETPWGPAWRLRAPMTIDGVIIGEDRVAARLGSAPPTWRGADNP